jgi:hypothetical protein
MRIPLALIVLSLCVGVADAAQRHKRVYNRAPQRIDNRAPPIYSTYDARNAQPGQHCIIPTKYSIYGICWW